MAFTPPWLQHQSITPQWQPTPGLDRGTWQAQADALQQVGSRGWNGQLWGTYQPGDAGYDPQKRADYDALVKYGESQGWVDHGSFGDSLKQVAPVALAGLGGWGLSSLGAGAGVAGASASTNPFIAGGATGAASTGAGALTGASAVPAAASPGLLASGIPAFTPAMNATGMAMGGNAAGVGAATSSTGLGAFLDKFLKGTTNGIGTSGISPLGLLAQFGTDMYFGNKMEDIANRSAGLADPFASQRPQYQRRLADLMNNPSLINQDPAYQFRLKSGQDALERSNAAKGFLASGNMLHDLQEYGQQSASQEFDTQVNRLGNFAGAGFGPGNAGQISLAGNQTGLANKYQSLGSLGTLAGDVLKNWRSNNSNVSLL
jgi:hypothetical protein